ncbi:hypothetical protein ACUIAC_07425 [Dermabacteraceae bacterium P13138]
MNENDMNEEKAALAAACLEVLQSSNDGSLCALLPTQKALATFPALASLLDSPAETDAHHLTPLELDTFPADGDVTPILSGAVWPGIETGAALRVRREVRLSDSEETVSALVAAAVSAKGEVWNAVDVPGRKGLALGDDLLPDLNQLLLALFTG